MKEVKVDNMVKFYVLCALYSRPHHGYELIKEIQQKLGKKVSAGQMYPFLQLLRKSGCVGVDSVGNRDKKVFILTSYGRKFVKKMFERFGGLIELAIKPDISE